MIALIAGRPERREVPDETGNLGCLDPALGSACDDLLVDETFGRPERLGVADGLKGRSHRDRVVRRKRR